MAVDYPKVEKLRGGAVTKLDEISENDDKAGFVLSISVVSGYVVDTLPPASQPQAGTSTVLGGPQPCGPNELPLLLDSEQQLAFLVKASDLSVNGMLALNGACAAALHLWIFRKNAMGDKSKSVCEHIGWQICIYLAPIVMYLLTVWVTSMTKAIEKATEQAIEQEPIGLNVISGFVLAFFIWPVLMGGLMTHCMTRAAIWIVLLVVTPLILIMFIIWGATFSHPKIPRRCFCSWCNCCGKDTEVNAAAQHADGASASKGPICGPADIRGDVCQHNMLSITR